MQKQPDATASCARRLPFRAGFLSGDLSDPASLRLAGSRCRACEIALFGQRHRCENCSSADLDHVIFARTGKIFTYTVQRYAPPPPHSLPVTPWIPRPIGWIDLDDDGPRVLGPILCTPEVLSIGMVVELGCTIGWTDPAGVEMMSYGFTPVTGSGAGA